MTRSDPAPADDGDDDCVDFQIPVLGLYADMESGRGSVNLPDEFHAQPPNWRLSLLRDWTAALLLLQQAAQDQADLLPAASPPFPQPPG